MAGEIGNYTNVFVYAVFNQQPAPLFTLQARFVVVNPVEWTGNGGPQLKVELYGCSLDPSYSPTFTEVRDPIQVWF